MRSEEIVPTVMKQSFVEEQPQILRLALALRELAQDDIRLLSLRMTAQFLSVLPGLAVAAALGVTGCSHQPANTYQGYIEGKFVYVASPQSGRLDHLAVNRGDVIDTNHPLFVLDGEPEASAERQADQALQADEARLADLQT